MSNNKFMSKKSIFVVVVSTLVVVCAVAAAKFYKTDSNKENVNSETANTNSVNSNSDDLVVNNVNNTNSSDPEANIKVYSPVSGEKVSFPIVVKGEARVFESTFNLELKSGNKVIYSACAMANAPDMGQFGLFEVKIDSLLEMPVSENVILEVFDYSAKDGEKIDIVSIPLVLDLSQLTSVKVFFNNSKMDPEFSCNKVFSVERFIAKTQAPARKAIELLLQGPSASEKEKEFFTSINEGVKINSLKIENGIAKIDFDEQLEFQAGGSCRVSAIRAQIIETLKQFSTVNDVVISINGRVEDILQP